MTEIKRLTAVVHGRVQGVSFRYYTQISASKLGLSGWVRNQPDGTVFVLAEGPTGALTDFANWLHRGSPAAIVRQVDLEWSAATGEFHKFGVRL